MTTHIDPPFIDLHDSNGNPYVGAKLYVYEAGTSTLASIYSNEGLSVSLTNPQTSDSAGRFARIYAAAGKYKIRFETSTGTLIAEYDNHDIGLGFGGGPLSIANGGTGATSAAAALTALGAASAASVTALSSDIADIQTTIQNIVTQPQGYLTLTSGTPVISSDVSAGTAVYYTPFRGNLVPIWDGSQFNIHDFAELTLTLNANHLANTIYDIFTFLDSGVPIIGTGPAWNTSTLGSGARGTGAGTTQLSRVGGLWVNTVAMTARNGATTYSVDANEGTYLGTLRIDGSNGQASCHVSTGGTRRWAPWNAYNRQRIILQVVDANASWTYNSGTVRQTNGSSANTAIVLCGLAEERITATFNQYCRPTTTGTVIIGIGQDSTTTVSSFCTRGQRGADSLIINLIATAKFDAILGGSALNCLEAGNAGPAEFVGGATNMSMIVEWFG